MRLREQCSKSGTDLEIPKLSELLAAVIELARIESSTLMNALVSS